MLQRNRFIQLKDYQTNFNERERISAKIIYSVSRGAKIVSTIRTKGKAKGNTLQRKENPAVLEIEKE